ncbi:MAG: MerR family transcriptional regulator [Thermocrispum sp.]
MIEEVSIAEAAVRSGLSIDTLRYYERIGLIDPPARDAGGRRQYTADDLGWIEFLTRLRTTGMSIRGMQRYADLRREGPSTAGERRRMLLEQRAVVRARIEELTGCLGVLDYKIAHYAELERGVIR